MKPEEQQHLIDLVVMAQSGNHDARCAVVEAMTPYIHKCVSQRLGHHNTKDATYKDCVQAAIAGTAARGGLLRAIDTFDATRGLRFITHAAHWIKAGITDTASDHPVVGLGVRQRHIKIRRAAHAAEERLGHLPSVAEVRVEWESMVANSKQSSLSDRAIARALSSDIPPGWTVHGLDHPDVEREGVIDEDTVIDAIDRRAKVARLQKAIETLSKNESLLVAGLFGFGGTAMSINELARHIGCSTATVIRRRNAVLAKLKGILS